MLIHLHWSDRVAFDSLNVPLVLPRIVAPHKSGFLHETAPLVARADHTIDIEVIQGQWERMGQFYSSLATGHTTASVALQRLVACPAKNRFYRANRDLGRVSKTEFLLSYLSEPQLRPASGAGC